MSSPPAVVRSFYKRLLPKNLVSFSSESGKNLFKKSLNEGFGEIYFTLANHFTTQSEPAYCGLGSLSMVLNSLEIDPLRNWKGPWRYYADDMLDCCRSLADVKEKGITLSEFSCIAKCNGLNVKTLRHDQTSIDQFKEDIKRSCSSNDEVMVVSYSRKVLNQTGDGHFSPIGAYNNEEQMVLVLDVARFKYPSYWVPLNTLFDSLEPIDSTTGLSRGYSCLTKGFNSDFTSSKSSYTKLMCTNQHWRYMVQNWTNDLKQLGNDSTLKDFWNIIFNTRSISPHLLITRRVIVVKDSDNNESVRVCGSCSPNGCNSTNETQSDSFQELLRAIRETKIYELVSKHVFADSNIFQDSSNNNSNENFVQELSTLFFFSIPYHKLNTIPIPDHLKPELIDLFKNPFLDDETSKQFNQPSSCGCSPYSYIKILRQEYDYLSSQFENLNLCFKEECGSTLY